MGIDGEITKDGVKKDPYYEKLDKEFVQKHKKTKGDKWFWWSSGLLGVSLVYLLTFREKGIPLFDQPFKFYLGFIGLVGAIILLILGFIKSKHKLS